MCRTTGKKFRIIAFRCKNVSGTRCLVNRNNQHRFSECTYFSVYFQVHYTSMNVLYRIVFAEITGLGKFDHGCLPHQLLLETLVNDIPSKTQFIDTDGSFKDVHQWSGVACSDDGDVIHIYWVKSSAPFFPGGGSIDFQWVPSTVESLSLNGNALHGTLETSKLAVALRGVSLISNNLWGTVDLTTLPLRIELVLLSNNRFCGTLAFSQLPSTLRVLELDNNAFFGPIEMTSLSKAIQRIDLSGNNFTSTVLVESIPESVEVISLTRNNIQSVTSTLQACAVDRRIVTNSGVQRKVINKSSKLRVTV